MRGAEDIHLRIAPRQHAPGGLGRDESRRRRKPARGLDPRPQFSQAAEFRDGEKLIGIGREAKEDHAACGIERDAFRLERAQIGKRDGENERQFLRLRAAGIVNDASVGDCELAAKIVAGERRQSPGEMLRFISPGARRICADRDGADRIVADANSCAAMRRRKALRQHGVEHGACLWRDIELEGGAGIEVEAFERARDRLFADRQAKAIGADRPGKNDRQAAGAGIELTQRDLVGERRVRVIDPRQYLPGRSARPCGYGRCIGAALRQRGDGKAVIGGADQPLEGRALENLIDKAAPLRLGGGREIGGEQKVFGVTHGRKMPCRARWANISDMIDESLGTTNAVAASRCRLYRGARARL